MTSPKIAYFISPHGYGHAARAAAVMAALRQINETVRFEIFTKVPRAFFLDSPGEPFGYHDLLTDIGVAQKSSLLENIDETVDRLDAFLPFDPAQVETLAGSLERLGCHLVLCDIAPLGIAVAHAAGLPATLIENFTWDWIYEGYLADDQRLQRHILYLRDIFAAADYHIQTRPVCLPQPVDLTTNPVSRKSRTLIAAVRQQLGVPEEARVVMVTMGGSGPWDYPLLEALTRQHNLYFIIANNSDTLEQQANFMILPRHSNFFHPDLVNAADVIIGKAGYSTLAEVYYAGIPFGYIIRPHFREAPILESYIEEAMQGQAITEAQFREGQWLARLPSLLSAPRLQRDGPNGADQIAEFINTLL